jgi:hypothetical protein
MALASPWRDSRDQSRLREVSELARLAITHRNDFESGIRLQESTVLPDFREPLLH